MNVLKSIQLAWLQYREFHKVLAELESYTDDELISDLRVDRADLPRIAYEEAELRIAALAAQHRREAGRKPEGYAALFNTAAGTYDPFRPQPRLN